MSLKIFYSHSLGDFVVDAVCDCGHLERDHGSFLSGKKSNKTRVHDGGSCCVNKCECMKFTWSRWMTISEFLKNFSTNQEKRLAESL
jgi:hypothetical protein